MGISTDGLLVYGYDLGGEDDEWKLKEVQQGPDNPFGSFIVSWFNSEDDDDWEHEDGETLTIQEMMLKRLYDAVPQNFKEAAKPGHRDHESMVIDYYGVRFVEYCSDVSPMYILAAHKYEVRRGGIVIIDVDTIKEQAKTGDWDVKLQKALDLLDIHPIQERPTWLLTSYADGF